MRIVDSTNPAIAIRLRMSEAERSLLLRLLMIDPQTASALHRARPANGMLEADLTFEQVRDLAGYVAFEALHTGDRQLEARLNRLFDRLEDAMRRA